MSRRVHAAALGLALGLLGCHRGGASTPPGPPLTDDRDLELVSPPRWRVTASISTPVETVGFRVGPSLARSVHLTGLDELVLRDVWEDRRVATLLEHGALPRFVELSSDATRLAVALADGSLRLWDATDGRLLASFEDLAAPESLWLSTDGSVLVAALADGTCRLWDGRTGELRRTLGPFEGRRVGARPSPDGRRVAVVSDELAELIDVATGRRIASLDTNTRGIDALRFSPDGQLVAGPHERGAAIWRTEDGARAGLLVQPTADDPGDAYVRELWWSTTGRWLALHWSGDESWLTVHDAGTGRRVWVHPVLRPRPPSFSIDDDAMALVDERSFVAISLPSGAPLARADQAVRAVVLRRPSPRAVVLARDPSDLELEGSALAVAADDGAGDHRSTPDGRWLVGNERHHRYGTTFGDPFVLDAETLERVSPMPGRTIAGARFDAEGRHLFTGGHRLRQWDAETLAPLAECPHHPSRRGIVDDFAPIRDGRLLVARVDRTLLLYRVDEHGCTLDSKIEPLTFGSGSALGAVRPRAQEVLFPVEVDLGWPRLQSTANAEPLRELGKVFPWRSAVSPDGRTLAVSDEGRVFGHRREGLAWSFQTPDPLDPSSESTADLTALAFGPSGDRLVVADVRGRIRLLDPTTGTQRELHRFDDPSPSDHAYALAMAGPDAVLVRIDDVLHLLSASAEGEPLATIPGVRALAVHPDGEHLALSVGRGCGRPSRFECRGRPSVRIVTVDGLREQTTTPVPGHGLDTLSFAPHGRALVGTGGGAMHRLEPPKGP